MTYLRFHFFFNVPLLFVLWLWPGRLPFSSAHAAAAAIVIGVVLVFASVWDNHAIATGLWSFPAGKVRFRIGWCPIEEYAFFLIQTVGCLLLVHAVASALPMRFAPGLAFADPQFWVPAACVFAAWVVAGRCPASLCGKGTKRHYAFHLFYWFVPILVLQWLLAWPILAMNLALIGAVVPSLATYFSTADVVAIRHEVWRIDESQITGHKIFGVLPWEEIAFFGIANLVIVQSYLMFLAAVLRA